METADRELIVAAAKAASIAGEWARKASPGRWAQTSGDYVEGFFVKHPRGGYGKLWNPLADDGDAFRLAVSLRLLILPESCGARVAVDCFAPVAGATQATGSDPAAATRRAIVCVAASLAPRMNFASA